jgi:photosystem II stability/assembly factor-like uncharacterized protein
VQAQSYLPVAGAAAGWKWLYPPTTGLTNNCVAKTKQGIMLYQGDGRHGVRSSDNGKTWIEFQVAIRDTMYDDTSLGITISKNLQFLNDSVGTYSGADGRYPFITEDGGLTWRALPYQSNNGGYGKPHMIGKNDKLWWVEFFDGYHTDSVNITTDAGMHWYEWGKDSVDRYDYFFMLDTMHAWTIQSRKGGLDSLTNNDTLYTAYKRTNDGGKSWDTLSYKLTTTGTYNVLLYSPEGVYLDLLNGVEYIPRFGSGQTTDGGKTWMTYPDQFYSNAIISKGGNSNTQTYQTIDTAGVIIALAIPNDSLVCFGNSSDYGATWQINSYALHAPDVGKYPYTLDIRIINRTTALIGGERGIFYATTDQGKTWFPSNDVGEFYDAIPFFYDKGNGFLCAASNVYSGGLFHTSDEGQNWNLVSSVPIRTWYFSAPSLNFMIVGGDSGVYKSTNAGKTFAKMTTLPAYTSALGQVVFSDSLYGWLFTNCRGVWRTSDGGQTWNNVMPEYDSCQSGVYYFVWASSLSRNEIYVLEDNLYHTTNGGATWDTVNVNGTKAYPYGIYFVTSKHGYWYGQGVTSETTDGGKTWFDAPDVDPKYRNIYFTDSLFGFTPEGWTSDGGKTWHAAGCRGDAAWWFDSSQCIMIGDIQDSTDPFGSSGWQRIFHGNFDSVQVGVAEPPLLPTANALITNYPNPFSEMTNIELRMPDEGRGTLNVYDMLGREVADLTQQLNGQSTIEFNAAGLQPGIYFCKGVFGAQSFTSKLVVVK